MISLLQLQYFCALAKGGSLTSTAEKLFISQSTLSAAITKLEKEVGVPLFDRDKGKIQLNRAGAAYLRHIHAALLELEQGRKAGSEYHGKKGHGQRGQEQNHGQDLHTHFTIFFRHWRMISSRDRVSTSTPFSAWATSALV